MLCSLITCCSWKKRMPELERKNLIRNNSYEHLLNIYSVPGLFPGTTPFSLPDTLGGRRCHHPCFTRKEENGDSREMTGHFPNCAERYIVQKVLVCVS